MDQVTGFFTTKIPIGLWGKAVFTWFTSNFDWFFRGLASLIGFVLDNMVAGLLAIPPLLLIIILAGIAYALQKSWKLALGTLLGFLLMYNQGLWKETVQTLVLVCASTLVSMAIGVPLGIWAAHSPRVWRVLNPILDLMQTMPTYVYLIPALILFGLGMPSGMLVTIIFAAPAPLRMTYLGLTGIPKALIEAGQSFGATKSQLLWKVELPAALPSIMAGVTQCIMLSLSMVVIAGLIGANGLGSQVVRGLNQMNVPLGVESGISIVILAIILDRVTRLSAGAAK
ncbi:MAG: choline ABC transporter permease subunit [Alphaproteobacteria bacterium]|nr:choline ABC transporter permease subunit [Alphaproteobacteria bacterium]